MNRILFPTDLSDLSKNAYKYISSFANQLKTEVTVLHAHSFQDDLRTIFLPNRDLWSKLTDFVKDENDRQPDNVSLLMRKGKPLDEILKVANSSRYRYIAMSKKRSYNVYRRLTGSKTNRVITKAEHPVLVIPEETQFDGIKNILVVDANYQTLASPLQEQLLLLSLSCQANLHYIDIDPNSKQWSGQQTQLQKNQLLVQKHIPVDFASEVVLEYIPENKIDLMVMVTERKEIFNQLYQYSFSSQENSYKEIPLLVYNRNFLKNKLEQAKPKKEELTELSLPVS